MSDTSENEFISRWIERDKSVSNTESLERLYEAIENDIDISEEFTFYAREVEERYSLFFGSDVALFFDENPHLSRMAKFELSSGVLLNVSDDTKVFRVSSSMKLLKDEEYATTIHDAVKVTVYIGRDAYEQQKLFVKRLTFLDDPKTPLLRFSTQLE